jgi:flagellar hook-length control protein FliK
VAAELPDAELKSAKIIPDTESSTKAVPLVPVPVAAPDPSAELDITIQSPLMLATSIDSGKVPALGPQTALLRSTEPRRSVATSTTSVVLPFGTQPPEVSVSARVVAPDIATLAMPEQWATSDHSVLATAPAKSSGLTAASVTEAAPAIAPFAEIVPGPMALPPAAADVTMRATPLPASATSAVSFQPLPHQVAEAGQQIVLRTASAAADKVSTVSVDLRPPELGRVEVRLTFHEGKVQVSMVAERLETYEAFRQDKANIEQQMQQAGFQMGGGGLDLQHGRLPRDTQDQAPRPQSLTQTDSEEAETEATPLSRLTSDSLIDLIA